VYHRLNILKGNSENCLFSLRKRNAAMNFDLVKSVTKHSKFVFAFTFIAAIIALLLFYSNTAWQRRATIETLISSSKLNTSAVSSSHDQFYNLLGLSHPLDNKDFRLDDQVCHKGLIYTE
jgi:hypothetical protein